MKNLCLWTVWASFSIVTNVESLTKIQNCQRKPSIETSEEILVHNKRDLSKYFLQHPLFPAKLSIGEDRTFEATPNIQVYTSTPKVGQSTIYNKKIHEIKKNTSNVKRKRDTFGKSKRPLLAENLSGGPSTPTSPYQEPLSSFGLSYLQSEEAKNLNAEPIEKLDETLTAYMKSQPQTYTRYLSDSTVFRIFPRFNIPLRSLQLDSGQESTYNSEASEIIEPTYIIPKDVNNKEVPLIIPSSSKSTTQGVSIRDGEFSRKEIRNNNGEYFSGYKDSAASSVDVGTLAPAADGGQVLVRRGSYSFTSPEGLRYRVDYTADETGYHATQVPVQ